MEKEHRAKELALEAAVALFLLVALAGLLAGAEGYVAALRALAVGAVVVFAGPFPARVLLEALEPPAPPEADEAGEEKAQPRGRRPA